MKRIILLLSALFVIVIAIIGVVSFGYSWGMADRANLTDDEAALHTYSAPNVSYIDGINIPHYNPPLAPYNWNVRDYKIPKLEVPDYTIPESEVPDFKVPSINIISIVPLLICASTSLTYIVPSCIV